MQSLQGQLLVASRQLLDPNFIQTVLLIVQHGEEGALAVVLNRPLETTVAQACEEPLEGACAAESLLHQGGPCQGPLMVVHTHANRSDIEVMKGVHFTTDRNKIEWLLNYNEAPIKFFVGYTGWGPGQLENEMESGSWLHTTADDSQIFNGGSNQWSALTTRLTLGQWINPDRIPEDPSMN